MKLKVIRFSSQSDSTNGLLFDVTNGTKFLCYTLEDERREEKVMAETRIPAGVYSILLRRGGGFHGRYTKKYGDMHKGMLHVQDVPNFKWILIHTGNTDEHTAGCLILGDSQENNVLMKDGFIGKSVQAYKRVYPPIAEALENGEEVTIEYIDLD
uniref:DUF5675 domain-containing protein n=1 Tax=Virus NIOZ-UU157 TaxID=2763269 RepID=A0A7S9XFI1_9VIRU|nr:MAG: hypothetical protein NIOZUU157_00154 [Virus NIOZ-UU157]